ncbi:MAG: winged helix-turn-helix domain-containing protein [Candidatus Binatia bacterium]
MKTDSTPKLILRLKLRGGAILGPGKIDLLERIERLGSISAAAREMGMSYGQAWKLIETMNRAFPHPVVRKTTGGRSGGGAALTATGRKMLDCYVAMRRKAESRIAGELRAIGRLAGGSRR